MMNPRWKLVALLALTPSFLPWFLNPSSPFFASCHTYSLCPGISPYLCCNLGDSILPVPSLPACRVTGVILNGIIQFAWTVPLSLPPAHSDLPMICALLDFCS